MTKQELNELYIETEHGIFSPIYTFESYDMENQTYIGLKITKTSEEVYAEWLEKKEKQNDIVPVKTTEQKVEQLQEENIIFASMIIELQYQIDTISL